MRHDQPDDDLEAVLASIDLRTIDLSKRPLWTRIERAIADALGLSQGWDAAGIGPPLPYHGLTPAPTSVSESGGFHE